MVKFQNATSISLQITIKLLFLVWYLDVLLEDFIVADDFQLILKYFQNNGITFATIQTHLGIWIGKLSLRRPFLKFAPNQTNFHAMYSNFLYSQNHFFGPKTQGRLKIFFPSCKWDSWHKYNPKRQKYSIRPNMLSKWIALDLIKISKLTHRHDIVAVYTKSNQLTGKIMIALA